MVAGDAADWDVETIIGEDAKKDKLLACLGGNRTPAVLFTATHGAVLPAGDSLQERHQGALICQDWPGPLVWRKPFLDSFFVSRDDIAGAGKLQGLIAFFFACYSAGTPQFDDFSHKHGVRQLNAPRDFVAALPRRMLGLPGGGALAVIGHIDRAWSYSFRWGRAGVQLDSYCSALTQILAGVPVGAALEVINQFYASIATQLSNEVERLTFPGTVADERELCGLWTAHNDARNFVVLGDPAVRVSGGAVQAPPSKVLGAAECVASR
jgi:hypothetical protein